MCVDFMLTADWLCLTIYLSVDAMTRRPNRKATTMTTTTTTAAAKTAKAKMTAAQAKSFDTYSERNASTVEETIAERRDCGCEPYVDVFTFGRWIAQGKVVRKGEKAIRIPVIVKSRTKEIDETTGQPKVIGVKKFVNVFCRHQVQNLEPKAGK